ncbi:hypothetical protein BDN70DRAFT_432526 [Pholiota conissans]|uniref:Uncharacterized protein n=1 Tax=Pholiota conissans TaxID=109636 RepID=A0A9P5YN79_9AGAR|nr:hypothetical protein BDN70DRAFT_432526 [Pholiota conissans]
MVRGCNPVRALYVRVRVMSFIAPSLFASWSFYLFGLSSTKEKAKEELRVWTLPVKKNNWSHKTGLATILFFRNQTCG